MMLPTECWRIGLDGRYPIYRQIIEHFSRALIKGELCPGDRVPSIRELSMALKVNANTIQRAYQEMEREELICPQRGLGYFVMDDARTVTKVKTTMVSETLSRFLNEMRALGFDDAGLLSALKEEMKKGGGHRGAADSEGP